MWIIRPLSFGIMPRQRQNWFKFNLFKRTSKSDLNSVNATTILNTDTLVRCCCCNFCSTLHLISRKIYFTLSWPFERVKGDASKLAQPFVDQKQKWDESAFDKSKYLHCLKYKSACLTPSEIHFSARINRAR